MRAYASAPGETLSLSPGSPLPDPTADFPSLEAAVDAVEALLRRTVDEADTAIRIRREVVTFQYWYSKSTAPGLAIQVTVTDTSRCPDFPLEAALLESGWVQADGYSADGADGSVLGLVSRRFLCVVQGQWDGGDDSDSTYVPAPGCQVSVTCVPRRADDVPPR